MDQALLNLAGAPASKAFKKIPLTTQVFFSGLVTQRSPFGSMDNRANRIYLHGRPDQLFDGLNVELTNSGTYIRRPGTSFFFSGSVPETSINTFATFHQLNGNILTMMDGQSSIWTIAQNVGATRVFSKSVGAGQSYFQTVGNTLYVGDGVEQVAWTPGTAFRNWGISIGSVQNVVGPNTATKSSQAGTGASWASPNNITTTATSYATVTLPTVQGGSVNSITLTNGGNFNSNTGVPTVSFSGGGGTGAAAYITYQFVHNISGDGTIYSITGIVLTAGGGGYTSAPAVTISGTSGATASCTINNPSMQFIAAQSLQGEGFGFSLPNTEIVTGVQISVNIAVTVAGSGSTTASYPVQLLINGLPTGNIKQLNVTANGSFQTASLGGSADLWGTTLSPSVISQSNFGFQFSPSISSQSGQSFAFQVNSYQVTIYGIGGPNIAQVSGSLTTTNGGYQYVYAYGNPVSGHISNPTPPSLSTGNFTSKSINVSLTASSDPQVTQIHVYRTKDGGSVYYELPTSPYPNTTQVITDNAADATLNTLIFWPTIPYVLNTPPPLGLGKMAYHMGRIWGAVGNFVYYSANGDVALGNGNESFPPANVFQFPTTVNRLLPYSSGLLVFTADDVWIIYGTSVATFYPMPFQQGVGLLSYNALDIQGSNVFLYTTDRQMLSLSSSGINEIGYAIGDQLQANFNPANVHVASIIAGTAEKAVYVSDGSQTWFRCNWNQPPEGGPAWSPKAVIGGGCSALTTVETAPGVHQLLMAYSAGGVSFVLFRDVTVFTDAATGGPYSDAFLTLGSLVMAQPGQIAEIDNIILELKNLGSIPSLSILTDEISGAFESLPVSVDDPPTLTISSTVMSKRWYLAQGPNAARLRHMQIKIDYNQDTVRNELLTLSVFGGLIHEN